MRLKCLLTMASLMLFANLSASPIASSLLKKRVLADLDCIQHMFEVKYAPQFWKGEFAGWELSDAIQTARHKISANSTVSLRDCQIILRDFFNSTRDYHVGVRFFSTESASLPFLVKGTQGRYFVSFVDREQLSVREFPFEEGDEILTFGNQPIHSVVNELRIREFGDNTFETDQSLAELALTHRRGDLGQIVPQGNVTITGIKKRTSRVLYATLKWHHVPEKIRDFSRLGAALESFNLTYQQKDPQDVQSVQELLANSHFFQKFMVSHLWDKSYVGAFNEMNKHSLGARTSFIPPLGRKIWKSDTEDVFDAYIFETDTGSNIGYIRLPHYIGDEEEVEEFGLIMNLFQKRTDALVIDQVNNPGGSVFYLYALAATLTDKPLNTPKHHLAMTQEEAYIATQLLPLLEKVVCDESARQTLGENLGGYPVDYQFVKLMRKFCNFLVQQWEKGKFISDLTHLFGVDDILPHPQYRYTKPIVLLTNSLDFSGGDFFPAILQDNNRAVILGTRTAGAGGYVLSTSYPNHSGIKSFVMTGSLARRFNSKLLENLGVIPDIPYELSVTDLQENYKDYIKVIQDTVESLL